MSAYAYQYANTEPENQTYADKPTHVIIMTHVTYHRLNGAPIEQFESIGCVPRG